MCVPCVRVLCVYLRDSLDTGGDFSGQNQGNADCSNVANFDSIVSFFLAKDAGGTPATFGHKNETTGMSMRTL